MATLPRPQGDHLYQALLIEVVSHGVVISTRRQQHLRKLEPTAFLLDNHE